MSLVPSRLSFSWKIAETCEAGYNIASCTVNKETNVYDKIMQISSDGFFLLMQGMEFALLIKRDANNEKNIPSKYLSLYSSQLKQMVRVRTNASSINLMIKELMISVMSFTIRKFELSNNDPYDEKICQLIGASCVTELKKSPFTSFSSYYLV